MLKEKETSLDSIIFSMLSPFPQIIGISKEKCHSLHNPNTHHPKSCMNKETMIWIINLNSKWKQKESKDKDKRRQEDKGREKLRESSSEKDKDKGKEKWKDSKKENDKEKEKGREKGKDKLNKIFSSHK